MSFKEFKEEYNEYIKNNYIKITTLQDDFSKIIIVFVNRYSELSSIYMDKQIQEKIVLDLKKAGFRYYERICGYKKHIK